MRPDPAMLARPGPAPAAVGRSREAMLTLLPLRPADVDVWRAALDEQSSETIAFLSALLSSDETARAATFYFERDRLRFVVCRGILRVLLGHYLERTPRSVEFSYGPNGKPALAGWLLPPDGKALFFNVAHSEGFALFAFTRLGEIGVDLECMRDLPDWEQVAAAAFSPHELAQLRACPAERRREEFFRAWTRQEAVLKALGTGLGAVADAGAESAFNVYPLDVGPGCAAALACSPAARRPAQILGWTERAADHPRRDYAAASGPAGDGRFQRNPSRNLT